MEVLPSRTAKLASINQTERVEDEGCVCSGGEAFVGHYVL